MRDFQVLCGILRDFAAFLADSVAFSKVLCVCGIFRYCTAFFADSVAFDSLMLDCRTALCLRHFTAFFPDLVDFSSIMQGFAGFSGIMRHFSLIL